MRTYVVRLCVERKKWSRLVVQLAGTDRAVP